jgi:hypothetical protein
MYWLYFIIFILAVLVPDIITPNNHFISENLTEEFFIFILGVIGFSIFLIKERQIAKQKKEKKKNDKKLLETAKNLVESYKHIGEVNRKMDILMNMALGLADQSKIDRTKEKEIYVSIIRATNYLMKAKRSILVFFNGVNGKISKIFSLDGQRTNGNLASQDLIGLGDKIFTRKTDKSLLTCSYKSVSDMRGCIAVFDYDKNQEEKSDNLEILKFLASQAFYLYCYLQKCESHGASASH